MDNLNSELINEIASIDYTGREFLLMRALSIINGERWFGYTLTVEAFGRTFDSTDSGLLVIIYLTDDYGIEITSERFQIRQSDLEDYRSGKYCQICGYRSSFGHPMIEKFGDYRCAACDDLWRNV